MGKVNKAVKAAPAVKINLGGLNGKTVSDAIATRLVNAQDVKYDVAKGFITLEV